MMKSILISIKPRFVAKILNGEKTIEIRKRFPSDYRGWVYIYCTKDKDILYENVLTNNFYLNLHSPVVGVEKRNGKVVARFWCDKVEEIIFGTTLYNDLGFFTGDLYSFDLYKQSCLTKEEMRNYLKVKPNGLSGYAIHISKLEIFDEPKELSDFYPYCKDEKCEYRNNHCSICCRIPLTKAPQSFRFIEID